MDKIDYAAMSDQELKQYFLTHSDDEAAFQAYMDRRYARPRKVLIQSEELDNLPLDEQMRLIDERMHSQFNIPTYE
jgi:hypothetical protein